MIPCMYLFSTLLLLLPPPTSCSTMKNVLDLMQLNATNHTYSLQKWKILEDAMRGISEDYDAEFDLRDSIDKVRILETSVKQRYDKLSNPSSHLLDV
jgi:hypothetical protein